MSAEFRWQALERFVGRQKELDIFNTILSNPKAQQRTLLIQGPGGQGKTWLIKKMLAVASNNANALTLAPDKFLDMYSTSNRYLEGMLAILADRLNEITGRNAFQNYFDAKDDLQKAREQGEYSQEDMPNKIEALVRTFHECLQKLTEQKTIVLAFDTFEIVQDSEVGDWILSNEGLQMPNLICLVGTRTTLSSKKKETFTAVCEVTLGGLSDEDAVEFFCLYTGILEVDDERKLFIRELNIKAERNPLMLGLAIEWLDLPENTPEAVQKLSQAEFEQEIVSWLSPQRGMGAIRIVGILYGEQMLQTLVFMAYLNRRFNRYFLEKLAEAEYIRLGDATVDELWNDLYVRRRDFFFVKERPEGGIQLHDKLAEMFRKYVLMGTFRDSTGDRLKQFVMDVVYWYDELIEGEPNPEVLYAEKLAYLLRSDLHADCQQQHGKLPEICKILPALTPEPQEIVDVLENYRRQRSDVLARLTVGEVKMSLIRQFATADRYQIYRLLGQIASQSYLLATAQIYWEKAYDAAEESGDAISQVEALIGLHNCTFQTNPHQSLEILKRAHQLCMEKSIEILLPSVLYEIGFTYSRLHNLEVAIKWYQTAKEAATHLKDVEKMPTILNDAGHIYLLMGQIEKARISIRAARNLRFREYERLKGMLGKDASPEEDEALEDQVRVAALKLGMSYSTLGHLARFSGRLDEAIDRYTAALDVFEEARSSYWQTRTYFSRGEAYRRRAAANYYAGRLVRSEELDQKAEADICLSLERCQQFGFVAGSITASRRLGRLYHDRMFRTRDPEERLNFLGQARPLFEEALSRAESIQDVLEILENLTELAFLTDDYLTVLKAYDPQKFEKEKRQAYQDVENLQEYIEGYEKDEDQIYQFPVFQHLLEIEQAAYHFVLEEYDEALPLYIKGYVGMAQFSGYGVARYLQHMDHIVNQLHTLYKIDQQRCNDWCETLLTAWEEAGLTETRTELPQEIEMIQDTAFINFDESD